MEFRRIFKAPGVLFRPGDRATIGKENSMRDRTIEPRMAEVVLHEGIAVPIEPEKKKGRR